MEHTPDARSDQVPVIRAERAAPEPAPTHPGTRGSRFPGAFLHLLVNTLVVAVIDFTVWFAITFYVFLETRSVFATGMISGVYLILIAFSGIWFGSLVDHHRKKTMMIVSTIASLVFYVVALVIERTAPPGEFRSPSSVLLWALILTCMFGVIAGNIRGIAMPTLVTLLVPADRRDRANGLVGTALGVSILVTSVISGLLVDAGGMYYVLLVGIGINLLALLHLFTVKVAEPRIVSTGDDAGIDLRGTYRLVRRISGLTALILFSAFNNFLGGVFMALLDAYGLSMMSVRAWGLLWGVLSTGFIIGGLIVAKVGLGANPVRTMLLGQRRALDGHLDLPAAGLYRVAGRRDVRLPGGRTDRRSGGADGAAARRPVRAAGESVRVRAERRTDRLPVDRLSDRTDRRIPRHPVHDRRSGRPLDR